VLPPYDQNAIRWDWGFAGRGWLSGLAGIGEGRQGPVNVSLYGRAADRISRATVKFMMGVSKSSASAFVYDRRGYSFLGLLWRASVSGSVRGVADEVRDWRRVYITVGRAVCWVTIMVYLSVTAVPSWGISIARSVNLASIARFR